MQRERDMQNPFALGSSHSDYCTRGAGVRTSSRPSAVSTDQAMECPVSRLDGYVAQHSTRIYDAMASL